jgi:glycosyltransferase involved in cell wall biosynthesis
MRMTSSYELGFRRLFGGPKLIFWSHGYNMEVGIETWYARLRQFPRTALGRCADAHIVYSEAGRNVLAASFPRSRIFVAQNTIDMEEIGEFADPQHSWTPESPSIVSIGRFTPDKGMPLLVEAFGEVLSTHPEARLTLIGDGEDMGAVARAAGKLPKGSVNLPGALYDEVALAEYLNAADVAVFGGAVGLSVNHVLAYGLPVVAFSETSGGPKHHPEICYVQPRRTGVLVDEYNASAMARGLLELFREPGGPRAAYAQNIRDFIRGEMNLDLMVEGFESAVSSVA